MEMRKRGARLEAGKPPLNSSWAGHPGTLAPLQCLPVGTVLWYCALLGHLLSGAGAAGSAPPCQAGQHSKDLSPEPPAPSLCVAAMPPGWHCSQEDRTAAVSWLMQLLLACHLLSLLPSFPPAV